MSEIDRELVTIDSSFDDIRVVFDIIDGINIVGKIERINSKIVELIIEELCYELMCKYWIISDGCISKIPLIEIMSLIEITDS